jgi:hypothetical protein
MSRFLLPLLALVGLLSFDLRHAPSDDKPSPANRLLQKVVSRLGNDAPGYQPARQ